MHFGISTHLYHAERLGREYLADIGGAGFEAVELYTTRSHFDYHDEAANGSLARRPASRVAFRSRAGIRELPRRAARRDILNRGSR